MKSWVGRFGFLLAVVGFAGGASVTDLRAQGSDEGAPFLLLATGAHGVGLGRTMTLARSVEAPFWNPAGLAGLSGRGEGRVYFHRGDHITGEATTVGLIGGRDGLGVFGVAYQLFDEGTLDVTDDRGNVLGSLTIRNHLAVLTWAVSPSDRLRLGASAKALRFELGCRGQCPEGRVRGSGWAVDLGAQVQPFEAIPLELGWALVHLGPEFRIEDAAEGNPLPTRMRWAAGWTPWSRQIEGERVAFQLLLESEHRIRDAQEPAILVGAELSAGTADRIYLRAGTTVVGGGPVDGAGLGIGVRYDRVELDLARALPRQGLGSQQEPVHLTFAFRLGRVPETLNAR
jgi:hypothetical protein